jgi:hypothetical protein
MPDQPAEVYGESESLGIPPPSSTMKFNKPSQSRFTYEDPNPNYISGTPYARPLDTNNYAGVSGNNYQGAKGQNTYGDEGFS